jgi:hypothetical protein
MISRTVTTVLPAPREQVFAFLSRLENLPLWATEFARELKLENGTARVVNGLGEFYFRIDADPKSGVIDMHAGAQEDQMAIFPTRVIALDDQHCAYTFTMFKAPEMPDDVFESQYRSLEREFDNIRARFPSNAINAQAGVAPGGRTSG